MALGILAGGPRQLDSQKFGGRGDRGASALCAGALVGRCARTAAGAGRQRLVDVERLKSESELVAGAQLAAAHVSAIDGGAVC